MTTQIHLPKKQKKHLKPVPKEFSEDCKVLALDFEKIRPKVLKVYEKWKAKHESAKDITRWLRSELKQWYSMSTITRMIPKEYHRDYNKTGNFVGFTKNGKNVPTADRPTTKSLKMSNLVAQNTTTAIPQPETKVGSTRKESPKTHERGLPGKWNQDPLEYKIEELEQYDIEYLRQAVKALHQLRMDFIQEAFKWQSKYDEMQRDKKRLVQKLEENHIKI